MKHSVILAGVLLTACSAANHSFVVDVEDAEKPVLNVAVTICEIPPKSLDRVGQRFVGRIALRCEGSGYVRITYTDGTTTDCPIGYITSFDDWWMFQVLNADCRLDWTSER